MFNKLFGKGSQEEELMINGVPINKPQKKEEPAYMTPDEASLKKNKKMSYERKKSLYGYMFLALWLVGIVFFFLRPLIQSFWLAFNDVRFAGGEMTTTWAGIANFKKAFVEDTEFLPALVESLGNMAYQVPLIVIFSMFVATILNQEFRGKGTFRSIFFLPVIISSGAVLTILKMQSAGDLVEGSGSSVMFEAASVQDLLLQYGMASSIVTFIMDIVNGIFDLLWKSGIQIVLYIAALKGIAPSLYEASSMEGATKWESFWKITFPMTTPILFTNLIYTIIDTFNDTANPVIKYISDVSATLNMDYSAALSATYAIVVLLIIGIVFKLLNKHVFYMVD